MSKDNKLAGLLIFWSVLALLLTTVSVTAYGLFFAPQRTLVVELTEIYEQSYHRRFRERFNYEMELKTLDHAEVFRCPISRETATRLVFSGGMHLRLTVREFAGFNTGCKLANL